MVDGYKIKRRYLGENLIRPQRNTFTITWDEKDNMSSGWVYSDDAAGLTAGDSEFDNFFGYSAVLLNTNGEETAEVKQSSPGQLDITQLGTISNGDNVMIKFPVRGIKMTKKGTSITLSITKKLGREDEGYQYYAHCTGTINSPGTPKNYMYIGAYKAYNSSNVLKSWSGVTPSASTTITNFCTRAQANGTGYNIMGFYQKMLIDAYYMMKYGNPDSQSVVGPGYVASGANTNTGRTNGQTSATYGNTNSQTDSIKLFGLEDIRGEMNEFVGGVYSDSSSYIYTQLSGWSGSMSGGTSTGIKLTPNSSYQNISAISGENKAMFLPQTTVNNTSYNTYYCDSGTVLASNIMMTSGAHQTNLCGILNCSFVTSTRSATDTGARLMYLN